MRTSARSKVLGAIAGLLLCAVGVAWTLLRGPEPIVTLLTIMSASFAASLLAGLWIYRSRD